MRRLGNPAGAPALGLTPWRTWGLWAGCTCESLSSRKKGHKKQKDWALTLADNKPAAPLVRARTRRPQTQPDRTECRLTGCRRLLMGPETAGGGSPRKNTR